MNDNLFYFRENQKSLLELANTEAGRYLLGVKDKSPIVKITSNSVHQLLGFNGKKPILRAAFWIDNHIEKIFAPIIEKQLIASEKYLDRILQDKYKSFLHFAGLERSNYLPQIYLASSTFNPNASGTGYVFNNPGSGSWADCVNAASGTTATPSNNPAMDCQDGTTPLIYRGYTPFDTSALTSDATITAGGNNLQLYFTSRTNPSSLSFCVFASTQASNTTLATSDYSLVGSTQLITPVTYASLTLNAMNTLTLNTSGDSNISKTGWSKFSHRSSADYNNSTPGGNNAYQFTGSGANAPILTVTYTLPAGGAALFL